MAILIQLLVIFIILVIVYALYVHNKEQFQHFFSLFPDLSTVKFPRLFSEYKVVVFVPEGSADAIRRVVGEAGAGVIGNYSHCSFSSRGIGRFRPEEGAHPAIGSVGNLELVEEERIEFLVSHKNLDHIVEILRKAHPYEEPAIDIYPLHRIPEKPAIHRH